MGLSPNRNRASCDKNFTCPATVLFDGRIWSQSSHRLELTFRGVVYVLGNI